MMMTGIVHFIITLIHPLIHSSTHFTDVCWCYSFIFLWGHGVVLSTSNEIGI